MKFIKTTLILLVMCCLSLAASAQQKTPFNTEAAIKAHTEKMAKSLNLDANQKQQLLALNKDQAKKNADRMKSLKASSKPNDNGVSQAAAKKADADARKANKEYEQALRKMLKPDQVKKLDESQKPGPNKASR